MSPAPTELTRSEYLSHLRQAVHRINHIFDLVLCTDESDPELSSELEKAWCKFMWELDEELDEEIRRESKRKAKK